MAGEPVQGNTTPPRTPPRHGSTTPPRHGSCTPPRSASKEANSQEVVQSNAGAGAEATSAQTRPSSGSIQVAARVRPLSDNELYTGQETCVVVDPAGGLVRVDGASVYYKQERNFILHKVFGTDAQQADVFDACVSPLVDDVLLGYNVCVFAYGQTGSGKTFTMEGPPKSAAFERVQRRATVGENDFSPARVLRRSSSDTFGRGFAKGALKDALDAVRSPGDSLNTSLTNGGSVPSWSDDEHVTGDPELTEERGFVQRSIHAIFERLERRHKGFYEVSCSHLEIYNEEMHDLMSAQEEFSTSGRRSSSLTQRKVSAFGSSLSLPSHCSLRLEEDVNGRVRCAGLTEMPCMDIASAILAVMRSSKARATKATLSNERSSRSHSILSFNILVKNGIDDRGMTVERFGQLSLVDLAGSENSKRSGAQGSVAREAATINQSLLTLGRVITALVNKHPHVPYRDSKLTRLLQDSLGGSSKTLIVATVSPLKMHLDETISTLSYAVNAASIVNAPKRNMRTSVNDRIRQLTEENRRLRELLEAAQEQNGEYCARGTLQAMEAELMDLRDCRTLMQQKLLIADERVSVLTEQLTTKDSRLDALQASEAAAQAALKTAAAEATAEIVALHAQLAKSEAEGTDIAAYAAKALDKWQVEDSTLQADLLGSFGHLIDHEAAGEASGATVAKAVTQEMNARLKTLTKETSDLNKELMAAEVAVSDYKAEAREELHSTQQRHAQEQQAAAAKHFALEVTLRDFEARAAADAAEAAEAAEAMRSALVAHEGREAMLVQECAASRVSAVEALEQANVAQSECLAQQDLSQNEARWLERQVAAAAAEFSRRVASRGFAGHDTLPQAEQPLATSSSVSGLTLPVATSLVARSESVLVPRSEELLSASPFEDDTPSDAQEQRAESDAQDSQEQPTISQGVSCQRLRRVTRRSSRSRGRPASTWPTAEATLGVNVESADSMGNSSEDLLRL